ncbi:MAG: hypothetical protein ACTSPA_11175 [Promethearchaeota archaeon]
MKKSKIILALFFAWLSVFSLVITPALAVEWPHVDQEIYQIRAGREKKDNLYVLYDHKITFEYNTTPGLPISMFFILKSADDNYHGNFVDASDVSLEIFLNPILMIPATEKLEKTDKWYVPTEEIYRIVFVNKNDQNAELTLTITKDEIGTSSYIFGGIVSVLFLCSVFFILRKRSKLFQNVVPEEIINNS